ncbi:16S rRNA (uracil(1498)-N(3))-methyltransferase [hydrothermal vent metagenome]|uniref:16S rRNA (uracil(1498)-N(3))-methyltransferase n=1 Tax=hydrothermal vent metagenome TaxID=652676 RepID=A0A3B0WRB7_9ZZZZ
MRITRLYFPESLECGKTIQLDANASNHLIRVLRTKKDTVIILFNGDGFDYSCKTLDTNAKKTFVSIESKIQIDNESNLSITLIQGLSRQDRMEATIQKSVELGVNKIIPVICQRSNSRLADDKKIKKLEHWRKVAISACEQSGRCFIPEITEITSLADVHALLDSQAQKFTLNPEADTSLKDANNNQQTIELFIGPEGGLNDDETIFLQENNFTDIRFGPRILRTETAGPAVISALQMLWGDF